MLEGMALSLPAIVATAHYLQPNFSVLPLIDVREDKRCVRPGSRMACLFAELKEGCVWTDGMAEAEE